MQGIASSDVPIPAPTAKNAFAVRLLFPPAFAIGTQPRPTRCEYLGWSQAAQADRTPTLRAGNLHGIPSTSPSHPRRCFPTAPTAEAAAPHNHKIRLPCRLTRQWDRVECTKTCSHWTVGQCNLLGSAPFRISNRGAPLADLRGADGGLLAGRPVEAVARPVQEAVNWR